MRQLDSTSAFPSGLRLWTVLIVAVCALSSAAILIRWVGDVPSASIAAWRMGLASLLIGGYAGRRLEIRPWTGGRKKAFGLAFLAGVFLALHFFSWIASLKLTTVANSAMLVSTSPVFVGIGSAVLLRERPGSRTWAGLLVAVFGAIVIAWAEDGASGGSARQLSGDLLAVLGAVMAAGYLLCGRKVGGTWPTRTYLFWVYFPAFLTLLLIVLVSGAPLFGWDAGAYLLLFCIALGPQVIGHSSLNWALRFFPATTVSLVTLTEPVGAAILAWLFLHERPGLQQVIGGLILLSGLYWAGRTRQSSTTAIKADTA